MTCHETAIGQLRKAGFRLTPQRAMVLEAIYHSDGHLTADEVYERVCAASPYVDLSTVYRTLLSLKQSGLIGELRLDGEPARYEAVRSGHEHHHLLCTVCGRMQEIDTADVQALSQTLLHRYGFQVNPVHLTLTGLCRECAGSAAVVE